MKNTMRNWKESIYRQSLPTQGQSMPCINLTSNIELTDAELETICGGSGLLDPSSLLGNVTSLTNDLNVGGISMGSLLGSPSKPTPSA